MALSELLQVARVRCNEIYKLSALLDEKFSTYVWNTPKGKDKDAVYDYCHDQTERMHRIYSDSDHVVSLLNEAQRLNDKIESDPLWRSLQE